MAQKLISNQNQYTKCNKLGKDKIKFKQKINRVIVDMILVNS
jgi:hypothetical protein